MTIRRAWPLLAATLLEGLAAIALARGADLVAVALHAASSGLAAAWLRSALLEPTGGWSFCLPFACAFLVPLLGALGLAAVSAALRRPRQAFGANEEFTRTPVPLAPERGSACGPPAWRQAWSARDERLAELAAVGKRDDPASVSALWRAVKDRDEEVRLLAFSLLEAKTANAYRRIGALASEIEGAGDASGGVHAQLAFEHWELVRLGLVRGEVLGHELWLAEEHVRAAIAQEPRSASLHFLLGRIQLRRERPREALASLLRAGELGLPAEVRAPYMAEIAFRERRFDLVRIYLARAGGGAGGDPGALVRRYWL